VSHLQIFGPPGVVAHIFLRISQDFILADLTMGGLTGDSSRYSMRKLEEEARRATERWKDINEKHHISLRAKQAAQASWRATRKATRRTADKFILLSEKREAQQWDGCGCWGPTW